MPHSARKGLRGKIEEELDPVVAHLVIRFGSDTIERVITRLSADQRKLRVGDTVTTAIQSAEVMLEK